MSKTLAPWIIGAAVTAAFLCAGPALDGNDQHHGYPATMAMASHVP